MIVTNSDKKTLAYHATEIITAVKTIIIQGPQVPQGVAFCAINNLDTKLECLSLGDIYDLL